MSSQPRGSSSQLRANWTPEWHKLFVDICLEQVKKGNRPKTSLNKGGWKELCQDFSKKTGVKYDKTQLKNHWDSTKDSWKAWHKLIFDIGDGWDPISQKMNVGGDFWDDYLLKNPSAARFFYQRLPHCLELDYIFGGTTAIVDLERTPNSDDAHSNDKPVHPQREVVHDDVTPEVGYETQHESSTDVGIMAQSTPGHVSIQTSQGIKRKKLPDVWKIEKVIGRLVESVESRSRTSCTLESGGEKLYSIKDCVELLNQMSDVPIGSELYLDALDIFKKKSNREFFVSIPSEVRLSWLQRQTRP